MLRREQHGREAWEGAGPAGLRCLSIHMRAELLNVNLPEAEKIENNNPLVDHSFGLMLLLVGRWFGGTKPGRVDKALSAYQNEIAQTNYLSLSLCTQTLGPFGSVGGRAKDQCCKQC